MDRMENYLNVKMEIPSEEALKEAVLNGRIKPANPLPGNTSNGYKDYAQKIAENMGLGFNLGNTFDAVVRPDSSVKGVDIECAWLI